MIQLSSEQRAIIKAQIVTAEQAITAAKLRLRKDEVNNCPHMWLDRSYVNGHTGEDEDVFECGRCAHKIFHSPSNMEHI